jgi:hypothetical protein
MNSIQRRRSLRMAWATLVTVVSGSPYERKMLETHCDRPGRDLGQAGRDHDAGRLHHA